MFRQAQNQKHAGGLCVNKIKVKSAITFSLSHVNVKAEVLKKILTLVNLFSIKFPFTVLHTLTSFYNSKLQYG